MATIRFTNVSKSFGKVVALDDVSFEVEDGEYVCVLGPTGSGKTTLLKLIAGLLNPDHGTITFDGRPVNKVSAQNRNAVYVPQQYALFPHLTVLQNVAFGPLARGAPPAAALETASKTLELVRLTWRASAFPSELSGGMQQRVALARGLASGAGLLLLDEPLGALDARLRLDLRHKLRDLVKNSGFTAIHVTHDQDEAMSVGDEIIVLRNGKIQDHGPPRRVYRKPSNIFVANLIGNASFLEGLVDSTVGETAIIELRGGLTVQAPSKNLTLTDPVILALRKERLRISCERLDLDNLFKGE
ncbi:MAG TPA: ABC transporter ATP-binding protein, partial [Terriglobales bacterium]|nr:ABC transporter ATP-binding protein [Terriglobales bacterium]